LRHLAACGLLVALAACTGRDEPAATSAPDDKAALQSFLAATYGQQARSRGEWPADGRTGYVRSVCAQGRSLVAGAERVLLAVCTDGEATGHGESGLVDFFVIAPTSPAWRSVAQLREVESGSWGHPGTVTIQRIGRDRPAFVIESTWAGQGYAFTTNSLFGLVGEQLRPVAMLREAITHDGEDCVEAGCEDASFDVAFDLAIDAGDAAAESYDLLVHEHGEQCGQTLDLRHRLAFDAATGRYEVPDSLMREDCSDTAAEVPGQAHVPDA
jgi:hypothetical protein